MENKNYTNEKILIHPKAIGNIISESGRVIANCNSHSSNVSDEYSINEANSERIVKCWNEYDKLKLERDLLIEALKNILDKTENIYSQSGWMTQRTSAKELLNTIKK